MTASDTYPQSVVAERGKVVSFDSEVKQGIRKES